MRWGWRCCLFWVECPSPYLSSHQQLKQAENWAHHDIDSIPNMSWEHSTHTQSYNRCDVIHWKLLIAIGLAKSEDRRKHKWIGEKFCMWGFLLLFLLIRPYKYYIKWDWLVSSSWQKQLSCLQTQYEPRMWCSYFKKKKKKPSLLSLTSLDVLKETPKTWWINSTTFDELHLYCYYS